MATTKVSALAAKTSLAGSEELLINDSGTSKKVTATNLLAGVSVADGSISTAKISDDAVTEAKLANAINTAIAANTAKTGITTSQANAITANTAKVTNATHTGDVTGATELTIASGAVETGMIADDAVTAAKLANSINTEIAANTAKVTNATHTGDVTGATALTIAADAVTTAKILDDNVTADKLANSINTDIATGVTANTTANAALPKAGGTMTGDLILGDDVKLEVGDATGGDLQVWHDGTNSHIKNTTGTLFINSDGMTKLQDAGANETFAVFNDNGASELYHDNSKKIETTANGVTVTGGAVGTMTTDNDGSFSMSASNNFKCTPTGNFTLTFTNIVAQSGNILLVNSGGHTVAAHANTKVDANLLATVSTAGTYLLSYFSDGTNVYMTNSAIYT